MQCPVCRETALVMSERAGVEIDYCPQCRGVWLDRGELDKILERSRAADAPPAQARPAQQPYPQQQQPYPPPQQAHYHEQKYHGDKHYGQKPYRKKSFLEELFD
ncbi:TFIIB-type zinc ribbon-containing protein [Chitinimonas sp. JJ19]|uniref:TFIIB-type zinc ribbon-containing protein n=1 Tax=Chitinimonas sp. JJ19 TaxID=3109352 RepID=UPI001A454BCB|nr:zf-TFIIB domain-containing protein [Chitinimonas sp.]